MAACSMQQCLATERQDATSDAGNQWLQPCSPEAASLQAGCSRNLAVQALVGPEKAGIKGSIAGSFTVATLNGLFPMAWALVSPPLAAHTGPSAPCMLCPSSLLPFEPAWLWHSIHRSRSSGENC